MMTEYLLFASLHVSCLIIRAGYEMLKKAGRLNPKNSVIFAMIFAVMCLLWVSWFSMCPVDPVHASLPGIVRWLGFVTFIAGMVLAVGAMVQLRGVENIDHLVSTGLYSKIRHPMYAGFILWILGWATFHGAVVSLVIGCVSIANILYWRGLEEAHLQASYGEKYVEYRRGTWF
jgi:protein-S-isoprenylcysteine O-methyltransferase Ste14